MISCIYLRRMKLWHVLLEMLASAAVPALLSVLYRQLLRAMHTMRSMQIPASIAALAKHSVL